MVSFKASIYNYLSSSFSIKETLLGLWIKRLSITSAKIYEKIGYIDPFAKADIDPIIR